MSNKGARAGRKFRRPWKGQVVWGDGSGRVRKFDPRVGPGRVRGIGGSGRGGSEKSGWRATLELQVCPKISPVPPSPPCKEKPHPAGPCPAARFQGRKACFPSSALCQIEIKLKLPQKYCDRVIFEMALATWFLAGAGFSYSHEGTTEFSKISI